MELKWRIALELERPGASMTRTGMFTAIGIFVGMAAGSALLLIQELGPFLMHDTSQPGPFTRVSGQEDLSYGYSSYSKRLVLDDCFIGMQTLVAEGTASETILDFDKKCEKIATDIVAVVPSDSYAWLVKAVAHAAMGQGQPFNDSMRKSQLTGPSEQWIADQRVIFSEKNFALLDDATKKTHEQDLTLLATSTRGTRTIARQYLADPGFRERITRIVETLPSARQKDFLSKIRAAKEQG